MSWQELSHFPAATQAIHRSLSKGRLAHAYLLVGEEMESLERFARALAKTLNCLQPPTQGDSGLPLDSCDRCLSCRKIDQWNHPDIVWVRAESKSRQIRAEQIMDLLQGIYLKPNESRYKVNVIVAADRMNDTASNKFLKTLEEPPSNSVLILLTTAPEQLIETIRSRCQRITLLGVEDREVQDSEWLWLQSFGQAAAADAGGLLERYRLLSLLLKQLAELHKATEERLREDSPLEKGADLDPELRDRLEKELDAAVESEYRRQRGEILGSLQWWLRDIWLLTVQADENTSRYPQLEEATSIIARRLRPEQALNNLEEIEKTQQLLNSTNVQEALALEVGLLKLRL